MEMFSDDIPRKNVGCLYPHPQVDTSVYEFYRLVPNDILMVAVAIDLKEFSRADIERVFAPLDEKLDQLVERQVDLILQLGVPPMVLMGVKYHDHVLSYIAEKTGVEATSTVNCVVSALKHLGLKKIVAANKWTDSMNETLAEFLKRDGIELVGVANEALSVSEFMKSGTRESLELAYRLGRTALQDYPDADGLYVGGGAWLNAPIVAPLEAEFDKPVVTNNTAHAWHVTRMLDLWQPREGWGRLLGGA